MSDQEISKLRSLFAEYDKRETKLALAKEAVENAMIARSEVLSDILDAGGPGPYNRNGRQLKIVKRGETLFLRGKGEHEGIDL